MKTENFDGEFLSRNSMIPFILQKVNHPLVRRIPLPIGKENTVGTPERDIYLKITASRYQKLQQQVPQLPTLDDIQNEADRLYATQKNDFRNGVIEYANKIGRRFVTIN